MKNKENPPRVKDWTSNGNKSWQTRARPKKRRQFSANNDAVTEESFGLAPLRYKALLHPATRLEEQCIFHRTKEAPSSAQPANPSQCQLLSANTIFCSPWGEMEG